MIPYNTSDCIGSPTFNFHEVGYTCIWVDVRYSNVGHSVRF